MALAPATNFRLKPISPAGPDADFETRRNAAGVVYSNGFNSAGDLADGTLDPAGDSVVCGDLDTSVKASGSSSLRFKFRAGYRSTNVGGGWDKIIATSFGAGDDMYWQWRYRFDTAWLNAAQNYWSSSIKQFMMTGENSLCQGSEIAPIYYQDRIDSYADCGHGFQTDVGNNALCDHNYPGGSGPYDANDCASGWLTQQGASLTASPNGSGYNCRGDDQYAGDGLGSGCWLFDGKANQWLTFYMHVHLATFGGTTGNTLAFYVASGGGAYKQWGRASGWYWANTLDNFFNRIRLETYMTEFGQGQGSPAPADAYCWYDEIIVSSQPIAAPNN